MSSSDYLRNCLSNHATNPFDTSFGVKHCLRGSLDDLLSSDGSFFEKAYHTEPHVTLYDVEQAVEQGIDDWVDQVTNNDEACVKLEILGHKYPSSALRTYGNNSEHLSVMLLSTIELWIALDKIAIKEIPMLADCSPEVPTSLLEDLLLCKAAGLSRLRGIHQYLTHRHSQSRHHPKSQSQWSVFSPSITAGTFTVRYYEESPHPQYLKGQLEESAQRDVGKKVVELEKANARHADLKQQVINTDHSSAATQDGWQFHPRSAGLSEGLDGWK